MTDFLSKQKKAFILTFTVMIIVLTSIFIVTESQLNINHNELHTFVVQHGDMTTELSESDFRELLQNNDDEIFILKNDTTIEFSTESWRDNFGYYKEDIEGQNFFTLIHPNDLPYFANEMIELVNTGKEISGIGPFRIKDIDEEYHLFLANGLPIYDEHDELIRIGLVLIDVSIPLGGSSGLSSALAFNDWLF